MTPDRWQQISQIYHDALTRDTGDRAGFLREACAGDDALQQEVVSLLANERHAAGFLSEPAFAAAAGIGTDAGGTLLTGRRIGVYEIQARLGAGGMGEVYRARDTKLGREVAIKILSRVFTSDPERIARFEREARVLASVNHPNIGGIYGLEEADGVKALVLELVEGEDLSQRIARGPLSVEEALPMAKQIADALEAAHDKGVIHRDLKPANVMVTHSGVVKVLDFGLAAVAQEPGSPEIDATQSPTVTMAGTRAGVILGTAAYMSPEQAAGKATDKRSDVWSFGVMLWEMLTGQRLFDGETISHTLADVLRAEIDFGKLPRETPPVIGEMLRRCLDRDTRSRLRDIGEARVTIQRHLANPASAGATRADPSRAARQASWLTAAACGVAAVAVASAAAMAFVHFREQPPVAVPARFQIPPPDETTFGTTGVLSPDGRRIAFEAPGPDGRTLLWVRSLNALDARPLPGSEGASPGPFWSPDSRFLAFGVNGSPGRLRKVDASGGPPQTLCEYNGGFREGAWSAEGVILFGAAGTGVLRVSGAGGPTSPVTRIDASRQEIQHAGPAFLPDGRRFLYHRASRAPEHRGIYIGSLDATPENQSTTRLLVADSDPAYVPASNSSHGHLLFLREGLLMAQGFDGGSKLTGDAIPLAEDVGNTGSYGWFSASATGGLAFRTGRSVTTELVWFDRQGKRIGQLGPRAEYGVHGIQLSPDGKRVVVTRGGGTGGTGFMALQNARAWTADLSRAIFSRVNPGEGNENGTAVSPDGHVAFTSFLEGGIGGLYWMPVGGVGAPEPLLVKSTTVKHPNGFSPDGRFLIYDDHTDQRQDLWVLPIETSSGSARQPIPFLVTSADETFGQFSPDGKWIAYSSDESGRREVYVQGFAPDRVPAAAVGKWPISTAGGDKPRWRRDGKELFYIAPDRKLMAVPVKLGPPFEPGVAVPLFETRVVGYFPYDVSPDGRFLLYTPSEVDTPAPAPLTILLNWQSELKH
jgi:serine/threonine protein kinase/Tol biopolymer transport system component